LAVGVVVDWVGVVAGGGVDDRPLFRGLLLKTDEGVAQA